MTNRREALKSIGAGALLVGAPAGSAGAVNTAPTLYELSNGGFYMAPDMPLLRLCVAGNGFEGQMSADAAGITACLFALSHLSFECPDDERISSHFHKLRDFAVSHEEAGQIFQAID